MASPCAVLRMAKLNMILRCAHSTEYLKCCRSQLHASISHGTAKHEISRSGRMNQIIDTDCVYDTSSRNNIVLGSLSHEDIPQSDRLTSSSNLDEPHQMSTTVGHRFSHGLLCHRHPSENISNLWKSQCAQYHQTSASHSLHNSRTRYEYNSSARASRRLEHPLMQCKDSVQISHPSMSSFSATKLILEASPPPIQPYLRLIRFDKPIGNWLLYWPCTWSIALAAQPGCMPDVRLLALFGAGAFFMRGAGCIINDMWDKDIDAKVDRTRARPLACGEITPFQALVFLGTQLSCALAILLQLNNYSILLGAASMGLVILYPLAKRYTYWPQLMLGLTLNWGVLLAWSALRGSVELPGIILYGTCTLYTITYDTIYSHQDKYDDMLIGVKSTALRLGDQTKPWLSVFTAVMTGGLISSGYMCDMTWPYYVAVGLTCARLAQQIHQVNLDNPEACAKAFCGNFYLGAVMFVGIVMANYLKSQETSNTQEAKAKSASEGKDV